MSTRTDDGFAETPLWSSGGAVNSGTPVPLTPSRVLNDAISRSTPRGMQMISFNPADVSFTRSIGSGSQSGSTTIASGSGSDDDDDGSERYCADLACIEFLRSPTVDQSRTGQITRRPLSGPTALQRRMTLASLQTQMQSIIRLQAWWRRHLAMQHYRTMKVCRQLLQQLHLQNRSSQNNDTAYQELQNAVASLHQKTKKQLRLQQQDQQKHNRNISANRNISMKQPINQMSHSGEEKKDDHTMRMIQTKLSHDSHSSSAAISEASSLRSHDSHSSSAAISEASSLRSQDTILLAYAKHQQRIKHLHGYDTRRTQTPRLPTKEMLALDPIYALHLALDNTQPESHSYFSRKQLMSPDKSTILTRQTPETNCLKLDTPLVELQPQEQEEEPLFSPTPDFSNIMQESTPSTRASLLDSSSSPPNDTTETSFQHNNDDNIVIHETQAAPIHVDDRVVSSSSAYSVLRFFGFVQDRVIEEEVFHNDNVYDDIFDDIFDDNKQGPNAVVIKELDELAVVPEEEGAQQQPPMAMGPLLHQSLEDSTVHHSIDDTGTTTVTGRIPRLFSKHETTAAEKIQLWWRPLAMQRKWETTRVCSAILQTVQYASHTTPVSLAQQTIYPHTGTDTDMGTDTAIPMSFNPELKHAIRWLQDNTHRQVAVRKYIREALQQEVAGQKIQKWFRKWSAQRHLEAQRRHRLQVDYHDNECYVAAITLQDWWRGIHDRHRRFSSKQQFLERRKTLRRNKEIQLRQRVQFERATLVVQRWWRYYLMQKALTKCTEEISERGPHGSGVVSYDYAVTDDVSSIAASSSSSPTSQAEQEPYVEEFQRWAMARQTLAEHRYMILLNSCQLIQRAWRLSARRQAARKQRKETIGSIRVIQRSYLAYSQRRDARRRRMACIAAIFMVQRSWTAYRSRGQARIWRKRTITSVARLQAKARSHNVRRQHHELKKASTRIQAQWRRYNASKVLDGRRSLVLLQAHFRGLAAREKQRRQREGMLAVIVLQANCRRRSAQKNANRQRAGRRALVLLQANSRRRSVQHQVEKHRATVRGIARLQSHFRRRQVVLVRILLKLRKQQSHLLQLVRGDLLWVNHSASIIQSGFRQFASRRKHVRAQEASVCIQALWRGVSSVRDFRVQKRAATVLQSCARRRTAILLLQQRKWEHRVQRIVTIQAHFRRRKCLLLHTLLQHQRKYRPKLLLQVQSKLIRANQKATVIQSYLRASKTRGNYRKQKAAIVGVQSFWRSTRLLRAYKRQQRSLLRLQSWARMRAALGMAHQLRHEQTAAIHIQSILRSFLLRQRWKRYLSSAISIQSRARGRMTLLVFRRDREAAVALQAAWRSTRNRRLYETKRTCTVQLQSWARKHCAVRLTGQLRYQRQEMRIVQLQAHFRRRRCLLGNSLLHHQGLIRPQLLQRTHGHLLWVNQNALVIQSAIRRSLAKKVISEVRRAAMLIQRSWRRASLYRKHRLQQTSAVRLQSCGRMHAAKRNLRRRRTERSATVQIQALLRGVRTRRHLAQQVASAVTIQSAFRSWSTHKSFLLQQATTIAIQTFWRGESLQRAYRIQRRSAILVQSYIRRYSAAVEYEHLKWEHQIQCLVRLQANFRRRRCLLLSALIQHRTQLQPGLLQKVHSDLLQINGRAILIQAKFREHQSRKRFRQLQSNTLRLQSFWRSASIHRAYGHQKRSALSLQSCHRRQSALKTVKWLRRERRAAVKIQSNVRKRLIRWQFCRLVDSAICIQTSWRATWATLQYRKQLASCIKIQSFIRGYLSQLELGLVENCRAMMEAQVAIRSANAATTVQAAWRRYGIRYWLWKGDVLVSMIQASWRGHAARSSYLAMRSGSIVLQSATRKRLALQRLRRLQRVREINAAILIETSVRGFSWCKKYKQHIKSVISLQTWTRGCVARNSYHEQRRASVIVQSWGRRMQSVSMLNTLRVERHIELHRNNAACHIQRLHRGYGIRRDLSCQRGGATVIQTAWRCMNAKSKFQKHRDSAMKIQCLARRRSSAATVQELQLEKLENHRCNNAVVHVQRISRGYAIRTGQRRLVESAIRLQTQYRRHRAMYQNDSAIVSQFFWRHRRAIGRFQQQRCSLTKLQAAVRMRMVRNKFSSMQRTAVMLQACWRSRRARSLYLHEKVSASTIQRFARRKALRRDFAASLIQAVWRGCQARQSFLRQRRASGQVQAFGRRSLVRTYHKSQSAAGKRIQRAWRRRSAAFHEEHDATIVEQSAIRKKLAFRRFVDFRRSVLRIQAVVRGVRVRQQYTDMRIAAIMIQAMMRCRMASSTLLISKSSARLVQRTWRCRVHRSIYETKRSACTRLQSIARMEIALSKYQQTLSSAVLIQATIRRALASRTFLLVSESVVRIQAIGRQHVAVTQFRRAKSSATRLQSMFRRSLALTRFRICNSSVVKLQAFWRVCAAKSKVAAALASVTAIQAHYRGLRLRRQLHQKSRVASTIQTAWRAHRGRRQAIRIIQRPWRIHCLARITRRQGAQHRRSIVVVQCIVRRWIVRRRYIEQRQKVSVLQAFWRMTGPRVRYKRLQGGAVVVQSLQRTRSSMRSYREAKRASSLIQSQWKCRMDQKRYAYLRVAACQIQRLWRGYQAQLSSLRARKRLTTLQSLVRGWAVRSRQQLENAGRQACEAKKHAATVLQSYARMIRDLEQYRASRSAAVCLQSQMRKLISRSKFLRIRNCALVAQSDWRRFAAKRRFCLFRIHVTSIQALYRRYRAKRRFMSLLHRTLSIQGWWRGMLGRAVACRHGNACQVRLQAVAIQSIWRMANSRKVYLQSREASRVIQAFAREKIALKNHSRLGIAAARIQSTWRRRHMQASAAACRIQAAYRSFTARNYMFTSRAGATRMQSVFRGYLARRHLRCRLFAALMMQVWWRDMRAKSFRQTSHSKRPQEYRLQVTKPNQSYHDKQYSATKIQAAFRRSRARFSLVRVRDGCVLIQKLVRGMLARRKSRRLRLAVVLLQSSYRRRKNTLGFLQRRSAVVAFQRCERNWIGLGRRNRLRNEAATRIQRQWRMVQDRRARIYLMQKTIIGQSAVRAFIARRAASQKKRSIVVVQACLRGYAVRTKMQRETLATLVRRKAWLTSRRHRSQRLIMIQSQFRGFLVRSQVLRFRTAVVAVQSAWRSWHQQMRYATYRQSIVEIQRVARRYFARNQFMLLSKATVLLEASIRGWLQRRKSMQHAWAVVLIQSSWRAHRHRNWNRDAKKCVAVLERFGRLALATKEQQKQLVTVTILQTWWRQRSVRLAFLTTRRGVLRVQQFVRRCRTEKEHRLRIMSAKRISSWARTANQLRRFRWRRSAVILIQATYRRHHQLVVARRHILCRAETSSSCRIQSAVRGFRVRRQIQERCVAVATIQRWWMAVTETKERRLQQANVSVVLIQNLWRAYDARRAFFYVMLCALRIQGVARGFIVRASNPIAKRRVAIGLIQFWVRGLHFRLRYTRQRLSVIKVQAVFRQTLGGVLANKRRNAARTIVDFMACVVRRRRLEAAHSQFLAVVTIQSWVRLSLVKQNAVLVLRMHAVLTIQSFIRMCIAKNARSKLRQCQSSTKDHSYARGFLVRRNDSLGMGKVAACRIQKRIRGTLARMRVRRRVQFVIALQSFARRCSAVGQADAKRRSIVLIQRSARRFTGRRKNAVVVLQSWARCCQAKNTAQSRRSSVIRIQSLGRRSLAAFLTSSRRKSVSKIQSLARRFLAAAKAGSRRKSIVLIQSSIRRNQATAIAMAHRHAVAVIQRNLKILFARERLAHVVARIRLGVHALVVLQRSVRRRLWTKDSTAKRNAAVAIQGAWRAFDARSLFLGMVANRACVLVQRLFRGYAIRRNAILHNSKLASCRIQRAVRCFLSRVSFFRTRASIVRVQCWARTISSRARLARAAAALQARPASATIIQSKFRQHLVSKRALHELLGRQFRAAVNLQRVWRGFVGRAIFSLLQYEATLLQSIVRMGMARKRFVRRLSAVSVIQRSVRAYLAKKQLDQLRMNDRLRPLLVDLASHLSQKQYAKASDAAEKEVKRLLAGDLLALTSAGICLRRLVTHVSHFRYLVQAEEQELYAAFDTFQRVKDQCSFL